MAVLKSLPNNPNIRVICYLFSLELGTTGSCHDEWFSVVSWTFRVLCWETLELSLSFSFSHLFTCSTETGGGSGSPRRVPWHQAGEVHFACITWLSVTAAKWAGAQLPMTYGHSSNRGAKHWLLLWADDKRSAPSLALLMPSGRDLGAAFFCQETDVQLAPDLIPGSQGITGPSASQGQGPGCVGRSLSIQSGQELLQLVFGWSRVGIVKKILLLDHIFGTLGWGEPAFLGAFSPMPVGRRPHVSPAPCPAVQEEKQKPRELTATLSLSPETLGCQPSFQLPESFSIC